MKFTAVAPLKPVPVIVTLVPIDPLAGEKLVNTGAGTMKLVVPVTVPPGVTILIGPDDAPAGTIAVI